jgi:antitoxin (DNA-binding transcriptional repressor) of toxin-antitoxin stability system
MVYMSTIDVYWTLLVVYGMVSIELGVRPYQRKEDIMGVMAKDVIHVSDKDAASDFASLLARVREGAEVVIEHDARPVAVVRSTEVFRGRLLSESIAMAKAHAKELGYEPTMDPDFAADLEDIINSHRKPLNPPAWD